MSEAKWESYLAKVEGLYDTIEGGTMDEVELDIVWEAQQAGLAPEEAMNRILDHAAEMVVEYFDDSMDGDHESALASCGWGTDEDYGCYDGGLEDY